MIRTITIGSCISVQGLLVAQASDGTVTIRVDDRTFSGTPVNSTRAN